MFNESSLYKQKDAKTELKSQVADQLTLPEKRDEGNESKDLARHLGSFLVDQGYIKGIDMWRGSWGCKYENRKIYINDLQMSTAQYEHYIFRLGQNSANGRELFPSQGEESDQYRFLHETNHAYQKYLQEKECPEDPANWYEKALIYSEDGINSNLAILYRFCYEKRASNQGKGLSTWGNVPDYNNIEDQRSQNAVRAIEDANELATMYLWHPEYLDTFLGYVAGEIPGYGDASLAEDGLIKITNAEKEALKELIELYAEEMREVMVDKKN